MSYSLRNHVAVIDETLLPTREDAPLLLLRVYALVVCWHTRQTVFKVVFAVVTESGCRRQSWPRETSVKTTSIQ